MQFSGKFGVFTPPLEGSRPPSGKSWIRHCYTISNQSVSFLYHKYFVVRKGDPIADICMGLKGRKVPLLYRGCCYKNSSRKKIPPYLHRFHISTPPPRFWSVADPRCPRGWRQPQSWGGGGANLIFGQNFLKTA